jgi:shikimate dehydrogenase
LLVNATPIGMYPHHEAPPPVEEGWLRQGMWVCDLVYRPVETRLAVAARQRGCHAVNGVGMLVHQGALAFKLWTGRAAPLQVMQDALLAELREAQAAGE